MTAAELLGLIVAAVLLQLAVGLGVSFRRWRAAPVAVPLPVAASLRGEGAWLGWREFRVVQRRFEDALQSQCSFLLQPVDGLALPAFEPGQFLTFSLDVASAAPRSITRCYSLSDRPDATHYRVTIKRVPAPADHPEFAPGLSSSHFHDQVRIGDVLRVKAPSGRFVIDPDPGVSTVLIGGGIGITPMMSMLRWCQARQPQRTLHLYYAVRSGSDHAFKAVLEEIAAAQPGWHLNIVYSRPADSDRAGLDYQHAGHVDVDLLRRTLPSGRHRFYLCGPPAMMAALVPALAAWGVPADDIHHEAFGPASVERVAPTDATAGPGAAVEVRFQRSGRTLAWDGRDASLLDFAERHGVEVESGCRSGGCGSCETRVISGDVQYAHTPDHDVAPGHCLLCVGRPSMALVLEA